MTVQLNLYSSLLLVLFPGTSLRSIPCTSSSRFFNSSQLLTWVKKSRALRLRLIASRSRSSTRLCPLKYRACLISKWIKTIFSKKSQLFWKTCNIFEVMSANFSPNAISGWGNHR
jgi:hypothetical protein